MARPAGSDDDERLGLVYAIAWQEAGPVKIGRGSCANKRLGGLQTGNPYRLQIFGHWRVGCLAEEVESLAHDRLHPHRMAGEWFNVDVATAVAVMEEIVGSIPRMWLRNSWQELTELALIQREAAIEKGEPTSSPRALPARRHLEIRREVSWEAMCPAFLR